MSEVDGLLEQAREAYQRRSWVEARGLFDDARAVQALAPDDLHALSTAGGGWVISTRH